MRKIPALDGVRGIAILLVLLCHLALDADAVPKVSPLARAVRNLMAFGWSGVDLFFVLSGFLITGILIDTRYHANRTRTFYRRRCLRILPLYYLVITAAFFIAPKIEWLAGGYPSRAGWLSYIVYLQNWWMPAKEPEHRLLGQFWSLGVEEQFYLFWPAIVWATPPRHLVRLCAVIMVTIFLLRMALVPHLAPFSPLVLMNTVTRMDALVCGAVCAIIVRDKATFEIVGRFLPWVATLALATLVYITEGPPHEIITRAYFTQTIGFTALAIGYGSLVVAAYRSDETGSALEQGLSFRPLRIFGKYSYGIYVYHALIMACAVGLFGNRAWYGRDPFLSAAFCVVVIAISLLIALVSYEAFEKWFLRLK